MYRKRTDFSKKTKKQEIKVKTHLETLQWFGLAFKTQASSHLWFMSM